MLFDGDLRYTAAAKTVLLFKTKMDDVCPVCGISLLRINLARHLRTHDEKPQFHCDNFFKTKKRKELTKVLKISKKDIGLCLNHMKISYIVPNDHYGAIRK